MGEDMDATNCMQCSAEWKMYVVKKTNGTLAADTPVPEIRAAYTWAPAWQQQQIGGQLVMACIPLPTCLEHLAVSELSSLDRAIMGGKLLPGTAAHP